MNDIVKRLRSYNPPDRTEIGQVQVAVDIMDAANEIERLRGLLHEYFVDILARQPDLDKRAHEALGGNRE